ncbi:MAG: exopolysaccharide biosynthesis protein [Anaerolineae bacterium]|nr:exopolysaccharide biosynthesis protein [Anaerolineae bacterium]
MSVQFEDTTSNLSDTLQHVATTLQPEHKVSLRTLLHLMGEQGMLLFCLFLTVPFLLPVSIPGVSTVFGVAIVLIGVGVMLNRIPWLPKVVLERTVEAAHLIPALQKASHALSRVERLIRPRWLMLTHGATVNRFNGFMLIFAGLLLMAPFGLVPFSNTLPALAILGLAIGILQRDGLLVILGHLMVLATVIYFGVLAAGLVLAGQGLHSLIGS